MAAARDVFISYSHADAAWVRVLAENLHQAGLEVFFDEWEIAPGDVLVHRLDTGIRHARHGILIVSATALERPWVQEEYAAMLTRAVDNNMRLIPVLIADAEMPPLLASRVWVDFRQADGPVYEARVRKLVKALTQRPGPPPRTGLKPPPPGTGYGAEGTLHCALHIGGDTVALVANEKTIEGQPRGLDHGFVQRLWELERARRGHGPVREAASGAAGRDLERLLETIGIQLGEVFLPAPVAAGLENKLAEAEQRNCPLALGLELSDPTLANLPWEMLRLPGNPLPLTLHPRMNLYRRVSLMGKATAVQVPGPLRILVAVGSPEAQNARGELLDMEAELGRILKAVEPARRAARQRQLPEPLIRILETGSVKAIHAVLTQHRYHVLYISCHATPGELVLEDEAGREDRVTAARLWQDALPAGLGVPLVVLAGCSTGGIGVAKQNPAALPSVARELVEHGIPAVIAMQGPVGDAYATQLGAALFGALATWAHPEPLLALATARRTLEQQRQAIPTPPRPPPEWAVAAFYTARDPLPLYDPQAPFEAIKPLPEPQLDTGVVVRRVGDFVGRRREQRLALQALRNPTGAGVVIHGMGGVGKSTLAGSVALIFEPTIYSGYFLGRTTMGCG